MLYQIDGANFQPQQIVPPTPCPGAGFCVTICNLSPTDGLTVSEDPGNLQTAKTKGQVTGLLIPAGVIITIPWVTDGLWAINLASAVATPNDLLYVVKSSS